MIEPKFTKGSWLALASDAEHPYIRIRGPLGRRFKIARVLLHSDQHPDEAEETVANANLIVASPDLYSAAECDAVSEWDDYRAMSAWCRERYPDLYKQSVVPGVVLVPERVRWVARQLRDAALAKARGEVVLHGR